MSSFRVVVIALLAVAAAFGAWEIGFAAFMADDFLQLAVLEGLSPSAAWTGLLDLYTISDGNPAHVLAMKEAGFFPWSFNPVFEMGFFRPLSSALLVLDHRLFGLHPSGYRLHGVLWSLLLVAAVAIIFRRTLPQRVGALSLLVFVLSAIQAIFCWNAARHVLVATALGLVAFAAHLRWRVENWRPGLPLSLLVLAMSLAASEVGVAVAVYLVTYELLCASDSVPVRVRAAAPALALLIAYLVAWRLLGHGASAGSGYIDPLRDPRTFVRELLPRLAVLTGGLLIGGHADLWVLRPDVRALLATIGAAVTIGFALLLRRAWSGRLAGERRALRWLGVATVVSAVPFAGTPIGTRCLLVPFVGGSVLIAAVIERWWSVWRLNRWGMLKIAGAILAFAHVAIAPLSRLTGPPLLKWIMADRAQAAFRDAELDPATLVNTRVVVLHAPDLIIGLHGGAYPLLHHLPRPAAWHVLSWAPAAHRFTRSGPDTLNMQIEGGGIESSKLQPGAIIKMRELEMTVLAVGALGPTRVRIRFDRVLDDASLVLLAWRDGRLRRVAPPAIGETILLNQ